MGVIALTLCLAGVVLAAVVGGLAIARPRTWTMHDAESTLEAAEVFAAAMGLIARRSGFGQAAVVIGGVLALGAAVAMS